LRADVAVDDRHGRAARVLARVRVGEAFGDAAEHVAKKPERGRFAVLGAPAEERAEILARDVLEGDVPVAPDVPEVEASGDVRMLELRGDARLVLEHL